jgi:DNA (cytosine-5)-methyltransferase 1
MEPRDVLELAFNEAAGMHGRDTKLSFSDLGQMDDDLKQIAYRAESSKAVFTVVLTGLLYKAIHPEQDVRYHQENMEDAFGIRKGYSGRGFDRDHVTPFLKDRNLPAMAETGWLTRSLEQNYPYDKNYRGKVTPLPLRKAFLNIYEALECSIQEAALSPYKGIVALFYHVLVARDGWTISMTRPSNKTIGQISALLRSHFSMKKASRLPVLAVYAIYEILAIEVTRFKGLTLLPLAPHQSSDARSGLIGDMQFNDDNGPHEGVEIKHDLPITLDVLKVAFNKIKTHQVKRYYILSNIEISKIERKEIDAFIAEVRTTIGTQMVANGLLTTIEYYLRLVNNLDEFLEKYCSLCERDKSVPAALKTGWNGLFSIADSGNAASLDSIDDILVVGEGKCGNDALDGEMFARHEERQEGMTHTRLF